MIRSRFSDFVKRVFSQRPAPACRSRPTPLRLEVLEDRSQPSAAGGDALSQIDHFVVIYQENWSFDALYGNFPGANGLANATDANGNLLPQYQQVDKNGNPITTLPNPSTDPHVPGGLPANPYDLSQYVAPADTTGDIVHRFYTEQLQIGNGALQPGSGQGNKFVTWSDNKNLVLSYFDATNMPEGLLAQQYTMADNFFHAAYGGSFLNHQFLVSAAAPQWEQAIPAGFRSSWDPATQTLKDSNLTIDGKYVVNTTFGAQAPHPAGIDPSKLLAPINDSDPTRADYMPTIGDRLDDAGVNWKWYSGGWSDALAGHADPLFQYHHQPFAYYANYAPFNADGTPNPETNSLLNPDAHLQDETRFFADLASGDLPAVSFIKPLGPDNEHPGYASLLRGQQHVADIVHAIQNSPDWAHTAVIITYDENGGRWDHVAPPSANDGWGDGARVPAIVISPYAKQGYVDHEQHDTLSILKTIEDRFGLDPLNGRDAAASSLANDFQPEAHTSIGKAYVQPDADNSGKFALVVQGTQGNDVIRVTQQNGGIAVSINGSQQTFTQPISRVEVYSQGGNDAVVIDPSVTAQAFLFGGNGNDYLQAGGGPTVLVGGSGNDVLVGGAAPSIQIGGAGSDVLIGGKAGDLLVSGSTSYDANLTALKGLLSEWTRTDATYEQKAAHVHGDTAGGNNGSFVLNSTTVHGDGAYNVLVSGPGRDLYIINDPNRDLVIGATPDETTFQV